MSMAILVAIINVMIKGCLHFKGTLYTYLYSTQLYTCTCIRSQTMILGISYFRVSKLMNANDL